MSLKSLKLKRYISEADAAALLASLIGEKVTAKDMEDYARQGIVPAYMQAHVGFHLLDYKEGMKSFLQIGEDTGTYGRSEAPPRHSVDIVPWPQGDMVEDTEGADWLLMAEGEDAVVTITEDHYSRIYAPSEVCKVAALMNDPTACPEWPAVPHSQSQAFGSGDGKARKIVSYFARPDIPEIIQNTRISDRAYGLEPAKSEKLDPRAAVSLRLLVYALATKAGYPMEDPGKCASQILAYLPTIGICKLDGNGTVKKHIEAARLEGERAIAEALEKDS